MINEELLISKNDVYLRKIVYGYLYTTGFYNHIAKDFVEDLIQIAKLALLQYSRKNRLTSCELAPQDKARIKLLVKWETRKALTRYFGYQGRTHTQIDFNIVGCDDDIDTISVDFDDTVCIPDDFSKMLTMRETDVVRGLLSGKKDSDLSREFGVTHQSIHEIHKNIKKKWNRYAAMKG